MLMARYISPLDLRAVLAHLCALLQLLGIVLVIPCLVALIAREFFYGVLFGGLALGVYLIGCGKALFNRTNLELKEAFVVTAVAYLLFGVVGALAFMPVAPFVDGFFESMSGFTTTGLSVMEVESLPKSLLFFRAYAQWVGGAGIIVLSLAVLLGPGKSAFRLYASEYGEENLIGGVIATARAVTKVYLALTVLGFLTYSVAGMSLFDALLHILATVSTGGFSRYPEGIGYYSDAPVIISVTIFMILGATSFPLYYIARTEGFRRIFQDLQFRWLLGIIAFAALLFGIAQAADSAGFLANLFDATSTLTTTGLSVTDTASWSDGALLLSVLLMTIGGSSGSTAGGIKLIRLILLFRLGHWLVLRSLLPGEAVLPVKYREVVISERELMQTFAFFGLYLGLLIASALLLVFGGFDIYEALFESASALGTVGLSIGVTSPELASWAKLLLALDMWAGRLEILPVLILVYPGTWKLWRSST